MDTIENNLIKTKCPMCDFPLTGVIGPGKRDENGHPTEDSQMMVHTDCYMCRQARMQKLPR